MEAHADGGGVVRAGVGLDRDALKQVPDLAAQLRVEDLRRAGWKVTGPREEARGLTWVRASKPFATPAEARKVVRELNGPTGPFRGFRVTRDRTWFRVRTRFRGTVDLSSGAQGFADPDLRRRLGGADLGLDPDAVERRLEISLNRIIRVLVTVDLPGRTQSNAPLEGATGAVWRPKLGERADLRASSTSWNAPALVFTLLAAGAAAGMVAVALRARRRA